MLELMKGNEAMAEAAIRAGLELYAGYPITPQSEIVEYMSARMPELGRTFIQAESEIISINTVMGGGLTGAKCMTSSSGVGTSLMQEGLTACFAKGLPIMLINVCRNGWGMSGEGDFGGGHEDYLRDTRGGGNGDYRMFVYCPDSIQEAVDLVYNGFDTAQKYRMPFEIMTEGRLGQMMESVELPPMKEIAERPSWGMRGDGQKYDYYRHPAMPCTDVYVNSMRLAEENEQKWELYRCEDAETVIVSIGVVSRVCRAVVDTLREQGKKVGMLRVISCWPFPEKGFAALPISVKNILCVETTIRGEVIEDVLITCKKIKKLNEVAIYGHHVPRLATENDIICELEKIDLNNAEEVAYNG